MSTTTSPNVAGETSASRDAGRPVPPLLDLVARWLFPAGEGPTRRWTARSVLAAAAVSVVGIVASLLRHGLGSWATIWAEDGEIFLSAALRTGPLGSLFEGYAGYVHVIPRLTAEVVSWFPLPLADTLLAVAAAAFAVVAAFVTYVAAEGHIREPGLRLALAATVLLVPTAGTETPNAVAYAQWYLVAAAIWVVLWRPRTSRSGLAAGAFIAAVALSAPVVVLLAPVVALRALHGWWSRSRPDLLLAGTAGGGIVGQLLAVGLIGEGGSTANQPGTLVEVLLLRVTGPLLPGPDATAALWLGYGGGALPILGAIALVLVAVVFVGADARVRVTGGSALALAVALLVTADLSRGAIGALAWPAGVTSDVAARYTVVPFVLLVSALLIRADHGLRGRSVRTRSLAVAAVAGLVAWSLGAGYDVGGGDRLTRYWDHSLDTARAECAGPAPPATVEVPTTPNEDWTVTVTCDELTVRDR